jgi:hypothetical protein
VAEHNPGIVVFQTVISLCWERHCELEIKKTTDTPALASYLDLYLYIDNAGRLKSKLYDKHDDFDFPIVNFPFFSDIIYVTEAEI